MQSPVVLLCTRGRGAPLWTLQLREATGVGMGGLALFETQATRLPSCVNAAPPGLWTSAAHRVQSACWALSETIDVSNPAGSRRTCSSRPPSASKRLTRWLLPRKPFPRCASSIILPAESWEWDCGRPGPAAVVCASRLLKSCCLKIPFSRFSRYCNKGSALGPLAL